MTGRFSGEGYQDRAHLARLLGTLTDEQRGRIGRVIAGGRVRLSGAEWRALQELLVAATGGREATDSLLRGQRRFQEGIS
ncbi:MAG: hypothetical protein WCC12_20665, partial [Anaerolineales bacterium]